MSRKNTSYSSSVSTLRPQKVMRQPPHLPLAGMCGGGSSGSLGGGTVTLLSGFRLMSFLCGFGEELEELMELVTVSPELYGIEDL